MCVCVVQKHKIYSSSKFQINNVSLVTIVTVQYTRSLEHIHHTGDSYFGIKDKGRSLNVFSSKKKFILIQDVNEKEKQKIVA